MQRNLFFCCKTEKKVKKRKEKQKTIKFNEVNDGKITFAGKQYDFSTGNVYSALAYIAKQKDHQSSMTDFMQAVYPYEVISNAPGALRNDVGEKIKALNRSLKKHNFPLLFRSRGEAVVLKKASC